MKQLESKGLGSKKKQAESLSWEDEELLWEKGFLARLFHFEPATKALQPLCMCDA